MQESKRALVATSSALAIRDNVSLGVNHSSTTTGGGGIHSAGGGRRPVKVWNAARTVRKALVVATYEEFQRKGREKIGLNPSEPVRVVLEGDGTQVKKKERMWSRLILMSR